MFGCAWWSVVLCGPHSKESVELAATTTTALTSYDACLCGVEQDVIPECQDADKQLAAATDAEAAFQLEVDEQRGVYVLTLKTPLIRSTLQR